jgi:hypothetical protein
MWNAMTHPSVAKQFLGPVIWKQLCRDLSYEVTEKKSLIRSSLAGMMQMHYA